MYHSFSSLLHDYRMPKYKGFITFNYLIPRKLFMDINRGFALKDNLYDRYTRDINFETNSDILKQLEAFNANKVYHYYILDLLNVNHRENIYNMFEYL